MDRFDLTKNLDNFLNDLSPDTSIGGIWIFKGKTDERLGSIGGPWSPNDAQGFLFVGDSDYKYILRFPITKNPYIVIESINYGGQLVNYQLDEKMFVKNGSEISLVETKKHTLTTRISHKEYIATARELGLWNDFVITFNEDSFDPKNTLKELLDWGTRIEAIKRRMKEQSKLAPRRYWRIGTTDKDGQYWEEMQSNRIASIGWSELGDLSEKNIETRYNIAKLMEDIGYYDNLGLRNRKAGEVLNFYLKMNKGDVVVAQNGQKVIALGTVIDDYLFQSDLHFPHTRSVDWKVVNPENLINQQGLRTTVFEIDDPVVINKIEKFLFGTVIIKSNNIDDLPLNTILYGPPGTGKTYQTIDYSVKIAAPEKYREGDHKKNKVIYEELNREGQIVFTTFHQSMCYEDFIEGIKPKSDESGILTYSVEDGLFKQLVINAAFEFVGEKSSYASKSLSFSNAYDRLIDEVNEKVGNDVGFTLKLKSGAELEIVEITSGNNFQVQHKNGSRTYTVSRRRLEKLFSELPNLESISNINEEVRNVIGGSNASAYWAVLKKLRSYRGEIQTAGKKYSYDEKAAAVDKLLPEDIVFTGKEKRYVMIIDEINRGNVSQVFGELITLIEEDKRFGKDERLPSKLPYSRSRFFVPPNLYVIGTMNTADRSVEALDTALRRRFCFIEMVPLYDLDGMEKVIADFRVSDLLETINGRIEKLIDRDHRIGHSYFLGLESSDDLMKLFKHKVIPLLQEYFYGNYEKMGLVLGSGFIDKLPDEKVKFARFPADENDFNDKVIYRINEMPLKDKAEFEKALDLLMNN